MSVGLSFIFGAAFVLSVRAARHWACRRRVRRVLLGAETANEADSVLRGSSSYMVLRELVVLRDADASPEVRRAARAYLRHLSE